ncbi:MAG: oxidoreductase [Rhodospirillales bacterium]|nr:oxidoreductase [Rhodospirillales bacterium]
MNNTMRVGAVPRKSAADQRYLLKDTSVKVLEIAPRWVQTDLLNSNDGPRAMPLAAFIAETIKVLATDADEVLGEAGI